MCFKLIWRIFIRRINQLLQIIPPFLILLYKYFLILRWLRSSLILSLPGLVFSLLFTLPNYFMIRFKEPYPPPSLSIPGLVFSLLFTSSSAPWTDFMPRKKLDLYCNYLFWTMSFPEWILKFCIFWAISGRKYAFMTCVYFFELVIKNM